MSTARTRRPTQKRHQVDARELPNYRLPEAAHYLRIAESTLRTWLFGQRYRTAAGVTTSKPLIVIADEATPRLSFVNMVEAHVLSAMRYHHGVPLPNVRRAIEYLIRRFGSRHPLAEEQFQTDGVDLFVERLGLVNVSEGGQLAMPEILRGCSSGSSGTSTASRSGSTRSTGGRR